MISGFIFMSGYTVFRGAVEPCRLLLGVEQET